MIEQQIRDVLDAARPLIERPRLGRIEFGSDAFALMKARFLADPSPEVHEVGYVPPPISGAMYGVPIVVPEGDDALEPDAWRLLDTAGQVIESGRITSDVRPWWEVDHGRTS